MRTNSFRHIFVLVIIFSTMLACQLVSPASPASGSSEVLFTDDFSNSNSGWELENTSDDIIEYANGGLRIKDWSTQWFAWSTLGGKSFKDVHVEVTAKNESREEGYSFGLMCNRQGEKIAFYYFLISGYGDYLIGRASDAETFTDFTSNGEWATSNLIAKDAASYRIGVDCGRGGLTLYVDSNQIASVADATYTEGGVGLILWSGQESAGPVTFDDFVITSLK